MYRYTYASFKTHTNRLCSLSVEQVKGSEEMKEKIIAASKDARSLPDYPQELLPDYFTNSVTICDKYLNNYQESHLQTNGTVFTLNYQGINKLIISGEVYFEHSRQRYSLIMKRYSHSRFSF